MGEPSQKEKLLERALRALEEGNNPLYESLTKQAQRVHEDRLEAAAEAAVKADDNARETARKKQKELLELDAKLILQTAKVAQMRRNRNAATTPNEALKRAIKFKKRLDDEAAEEAAENDRTGREKNAENEHKKKKSFTLSGLYKGFKKSLGMNNETQRRRKNEQAAKNERHRKFITNLAKGVREREKRSRNNNQGGGTRRRRA